MQAPIHTPLPIYVEAGALRPTKVVLSYKPFGANKFYDKLMASVGNGFGAVIPCEDVITTGPIRYYARFLNADEEEVGSIGTATQPLVVDVRNEIEGEAPCLPGQAPPEACREVISDPPCVFEPGMCAEERFHDKTWPWPPPQRGRGCAGCSATDGTPKRSWIGLLAAGLAVGWRRRCRVRGSPRRS
jgi:MYXO-CTERM domain-containing protein